jgi:predicted O-linked N-acetylglucosamine transferase (SPINDLY family)
VACKPDYAEAHGSLGAAWLEKGRLDQAIASCRQAIALKADHAEAYNNLGNALWEKEQFDEAIVCYQRAIAIKPDYALAYSNLGTAWTDKYDLDQAIACFQRALELKLEHPLIHNNLGNACKSTGQIERAIACYERTMALAPNDAAVHSNILYTMHFLAGCEPSALLEEHRRWAQKHAEPLKHLIRPYDNDRDSERRLRVGYVSPDFYNHAEAFFVVPLLEGHDRRQFEIHAYASVSRPDAVTERIRRATDAWHDVLGWSDAEVAEQIRRDRIDILIDLTMHMNRNRALLFARKPAPVQAAWLAYPGGTGIPTMDYRFTDPFLDVPGEDPAWYVEESIRLPDCWVCYDPLGDVAPASPRGQRPICFGSLNNPCKLNEPLLRLWGQVLQRLGDSRLLIQAFGNSHRQEIARLCEGLGIAPNRLEFVGRCRRADYLRLYDRIDIGLDSLPYNGITTTCDALWMGVPVVSLRGRTPAGRVGGSILSTIGLPELAADKPEDFVRIATALAMDEPRLNDLRATLRQRMIRSPLMDGRRFAGNMESAYRQMWRKWCAKRDGPGNP